MNSKQLELFSDLDESKNFLIKPIGKGCFYYKPLTDKAKNKCLRRLGWIPKEGIVDYVTGYIMDKELKGDYDE